MMRCMRWQGIPEIDEKGSIERIIFIISDGSLPHWLTKKILIADERVFATAEAIYF